MARVRGRPSAGWLWVLLLVLVVVVVLAVLGVVYPELFQLG
ncbi:MAG TPA: hypothetical protein VIN09_09050 [Chloroflexota bacterium]